MCGVPYHSYQSYLARLIAKGYKVAICEQTEDPAQAKGLVEPGHRPHRHPGHRHRLLHAGGGRNNYICAVAVDGTGPGCASATSPPARSVATSFRKGRRRWTT